MRRVIGYDLLVTKLNDGDGTKKKKEIKHVKYLSSLSGIEFLGSFKSWVLLCLLLNE